MSTCNEERICQWLINALEGGYGADASVGLGWLEVEHIVEVKLPDKGKRAMTLAAFVPAADDNIHDLCADTRTKFGKIGAELVHSMNPFKKPIVMFRAGATFTVKAGTPEYVGTIQSGIHTEDSIKHLTMAPLVYFNEEGEGL